MELPFTLTHPEPEHKVICGMVTLPRRKSTVTQNDQQAPAEVTNGQVPETTTTTGDLDQTHATTYTAYSFLQVTLPQQCLLLH